MKAPKPFTKEEDDFITKSKAENHFTETIANYLNRTVNEVQERMFDLARGFEE